MKQDWTQRGSTLFLKCVVALLAGIALAAYIFLLPVFVGEAAEAASGPGFLRILAYATLYATALPIFFALFETMRLLRYIDGGRAFSRLSVVSLRTIAACAVAVSVLLALNLPLLYFVADAGDAPGVLVLAMGVAFAPVVVAIFAAVLQRLLGEAIALKTENELTI